MALSSQLSKILVVLAVAISAMIGQTAQAEETPVACAAVLPCDSQGNVLPEFTESVACYNMYAAQCQRFAVSTCNDRRTAEAIAAKRKITKLQKKLRRAQRGRK